MKSFYIISSSSSPPPIILSKKVNANYERIIMTQKESQEKFLQMFFICFFHKKITTRGVKGRFGPVLQMLILRFLQLRSKFNWSLSNLVALLRMNLFTHRDLWEWLDKPFDVLPIPYEPKQLRSDFA